MIDTIEEVCADAQTEFLVELANTGRAGDVNFSDVITDHVDTDKNQSLVAQRWTNLLSQPVIAGIQLLTLCTGARVYISAIFSSCR